MFVSMCLVDRGIALCKKSGVFKDGRGEGEKTCECESCKISYFLFMSCNLFYINKLRSSMV